MPHHYPPDSFKETSVTTTAQVSWEGTSPQHIGQSNLSHTASVEQEAISLSAIDQGFKGIGNASDLDYTAKIMHAAGYGGQDAPFGGAHEAAITQRNGSQGDEALWDSVFESNKASSGPDFSLIGTPYTIVTTTSATQDNIINDGITSVKCRHVDIGTNYESQLSDEYYLDMDTWDEDMEDTVIHDLTQDDSSFSSDGTMSTTGSKSFDLEFYFYNVEEPEYHFSPRSGDNILNCFRVIADQMGANVFKYSIFQGNGRFEQLTRGYFGCGKLWMDIKRHLEGERWSIQNVDFHEMECWIGLLYSRRRESRSFAAYSPQNGFLHDHYFLDHKCLFSNTWTWRRVVDSTEPEYERNDRQFFADKNTVVVNGIRVERGELAFKMFDADKEDPAGELENRRFMLGKHIRTVKNRRFLGDDARKRILLEEERFLDVERRMSDPDRIK